MVQILLEFFGLEKTGGIEFDGVGAGPSFQKAISQISASGEMVQLEYELELQGLNKVFEARIVPVLQDQFLVLIRNVTESRVTEKSLSESNERFLLASINGGQDHIHP